MTAEHLESASCIMNQEDSAEEASSCIMNQEDSAEEALLYYEPER